MTTPTNLFRREALEFSSRQQAPTGVLRVGAPWVRWTYWSVLALLVAGLVLTFVARIERTTSGPVLVDPQARTFVAVVPAVAAADLPDGHPVRLEVNGPGAHREVAATALHVQAAGDAEVERAGFGTFPRPAVLVTGVLANDTASDTASDTAPDPGPAASSPRLPGRAVIPLGSTQVFTLFLQGFEGADEGDG
jgi:hypothetical protein